MFNAISRLNLWRKTALIAVFTIWLMAFYVVLFDQDIRNELYAFLSRYPGVAPLALVGCQIVLASFVLPCSPLTVLAGLLWGFNVGIVYSITATIAGSIWTFVLSRWILKKWVLPFMTHDVYLKINRLMTQYTWRASALAHANPAFPGASLGYAFGMTNVSLLSYAFGAVVGVLPLQLILVGVGHVLGQSVTISMMQIAAMLGSLLFFFLLYRLWIPRICSFDSDLSANHK